MQNISELADMTWLTGPSQGERVFTPQQIGILQEFLSRPESGQGIDPEPIPRYVREQGY